MFDNTKKFRFKQGGKRQKIQEEIGRHAAERTADLQAAHQFMLKQSRYLEAFFQHSLTPLVFLDRDFNFIRVNEAYAKAAQKEVDDFPGHNHFEFYPSVAKAIFEEVVRTKQPFQISARPFVYPDHPEWGVTYWDWALTPLLDDNGEVEILVFALEDVTAQKQAEIELEKYRERLEELVHERTCELVDANARLQTEIIERKQAENKLSYLASFPEQNPNPIMELDLEGSIRYINPTALRLFPDIYQQGPAHSWLDGWATVVERFQSGQTDIKIRDVTVGGRSYQQSFYYSAQDHFVRIYGFDVSESKQLEEELKRANEELEERVRRRTKEVFKERQRLYTVLETLPAYVLLLDKDYRIPFANKVFRDRFGESNGKRCYEFLFNKDAPCERCETYKVLKTNDSHRWEWTGPDGRMYDIYDYPFTEADGSTIILEMGVDITERIKFEEALTKERQLLMVTLNALTEGVIATDSEDRIFLINESAVNLTGYSQMEAIDEPLHKILYIVDDKTSEPVTKIATGKLPGNAVLVTRDLREIPISINSSPIKISKDQTIGSVTIFADITEKQKNELELLRTDKLESLGILAGGIAHDFNNFLAAILSNIQLAQLKYKKNEDVGKYLQESVNSTRRASELTRQLLTFSKGGAPVKKAATLTELIRDTATFALRGSHVKVVCNIDNNLWPVEADTGQISQVIHNLVINAKQAMPKGGIIEIHAENITIESNHRIGPGNFVKIAVVDQGIGIPKEQLPKIFDPFYTTKSEGSGLGLATSYSIIRRHDGYLEVKSQVGKGTTFFIYLPALSQALVVSNARSEVAVAAGGLKILLMDDEEAILKSVSEMLRYYGHQVVMVSDGVQAIEFYRRAVENGLPFDVVIMDLTIPGGMGGQEAIVHLRDIDPKVKAIVSSGYANDPIMSEYERFGFGGVVTKPYKYDELNEVLNRVARRKQLSLKFNY